MKKILLILAVVLCGCTTMADLKKPTKEQSFTLKEDYTRLKIRGLLDIKWIEGLKAGTYIATGEDDDGIYFKGTENCVIIIGADDAEAFIKTKKIPESALNDTRRYPRAINSGGLFIPKKGSSEQPKLFFEIRNATNGSTMGLTGMAVVSMTESSLAFIPFEEEKDFLNSLKITSK